MNSLNSLQLSGYGVGHIDHPGTPAEVVGAMVIKFFYSTGNKNTDIATDVLTRPEFYLTRINMAFIFITAIALFILGMVSYKKFDNLYAAILLQLTPFLSFNCL